MKRCVILLAVGIAAILLAPPASAQQVIDEIVAVVNNDVVLRSEIETQREVMRADLATQAEGVDLEEAVASAEPHLLRDLIDTTLLRQKAEEFGLDADLDVIRTMERLRQENDFPTMEALEAAIVAQGQSVEDFQESLRIQFLTQQVVQREVYSRVIITTEDARNYYEANLPQFDRPAGISLQEIVVATGGMTPEELEEARARAAEGLGRVRDGEDFRQVASEVSDSATARSGGELGFFETGTLREDYERIAAGLSRNQVSEIIELPDAFVILRLTERHQGGIRPFEVAQQEIQNLLWSDRVEPRYREYLTRLRDEGFVEVREGYLDTGAPSEEEGTAAAEGAG